MCLPGDLIERIQVQLRPYDALHEAGLYKSREYCDEIEHAIRILQLRRNVLDLLATTTPRTSCS